MNAVWFQVLRFSRRLIVRASLYAVLGVAVALAAVWFAPLVPDEVSERFGGEAVEGILSALANSLLAVATFSASAVVVAYTAASAQLAPSAAGFITTDRSTQRAMATFIGGFLFAIVALVALGANYYGAAGRTILFLATLAMVGVLAVTLLGWVDRVFRLALHTELLARIEEAALKALDARLQRPFLGGVELIAPSTEGAVLRADRVGHVRNIDPSRLQAAAETLDATVEVLVQPGAFVHPGMTLLRVPGQIALSDACARSMLDAFAFGDSRTFDQDPAFGLQVLVEVGARALSPGVNNPGVAILAIEGCFKVFAEWAGTLDAPRPPPRYPRVKAADLDPCALLAGSLGEIGRYAAGDMIAAVRVQEVLAMLAEQARPHRLGACARDVARIARARAEAAAALDADRARLRRAGGEG
jgi:uncharacterized membrane protein